MGLLDPTLLRNLKGLTGLLAETPIGKYVRGKDQGVSVEGLKRGLLSIPVFENTPEANQTAYEAAMNIGPMALGKIVYHGSPHKFDRFDASKIGTGEGSQAFGHGVYLADNLDIAKSYRANLSGGSYVGPDDAIVDFGKAHTEIVKAASKAGLHPDNANRVAEHILTYVDSGHPLRNYLKDYELPGGHESPYMAALNKAKELIKGPNQGALYKADLPDEWIPKMLDWDKPIGEQKELIEALRKSDATGVGGRGLGWRGAPEGMWDRAMASPSKTGEWLYREIANNDPKATAEAMRALGIPGIRYLDGGSRGKGQGSYNYVVFPGLEDQVKILERNGVPLGLLGGK